MSLRTKAISGVKWMTVSTVVTALIAFLQTIVLSRLLDRRDFGLMSMAWFLVGFLQNFADMGMSNALVRKLDATQEELSSVYWLNLFVGTGLAVIVWASTPLIVGFYREPEIGGLIPWLAAAFVFTAVGQPFRMIAQRDMSFHRLATAEILSVILGFTVAVGSALNGQGPYSLAFGGLTTASFRAGVLVLTGWKSWHPATHFRRRDLKEFLSFGMFQLGDKTANYIWSNVDYLVVGRILGADALGVYRLAYELVTRPFTLINPIITTVAYPIFAKKQNDNEALRRGIVEVVQLISTLLCPIMLGLIAVAPVAVQTVFGSKWAAATPLVQILGLVGIMRGISNPVGLLLMAKGRVDLGFYWSIGLAVVYPIVYWFVTAGSRLLVCGCYSVYSNGPEF
jgi:O-antigen/teichoic acid export membrane protein